MPGKERRTKRPTSVAGGRLDPNVIERTLAQQPTVGDAVQRDTACQHQMAHLRLLVDIPTDSQHDLFGDALDARRQVHVSLLDAAFGISRRSAEQIVEPPVGHGQPLAVVEVIHVQPEAAIRLEVDQVFVNQVLVDGPAVRCQSHQLVFAAIDLKPAIIGHSRVK